MRMDTRCLCFIASMDRVMKIYLQCQIKLAHARFMRYVSMYM